VSLCDGHPALKESGSVLPQSRIEIFAVGLLDTFTAEEAFACCETGEEAENQKNEVGLKIPMRKLVLNLVTHEYATANLPERFNKSRIVLVGVVKSKDCSARCVGDNISSPTVKLDCFPFSADFIEESGQSALEIGVHMRKCGTRCQGRMHEVVNFVRVRRTTANSRILEENFHVGFTYIEDTF